MGSPEGDDRIVWDEIIRVARALRCDVERRSAPSEEVAALARMVLRFHSQLLVSQRSRRHALASAPRDAPRLRRRG